MEIVRGRAPAGTPTQVRSDTFTGTVYGDPVLPATDGTTIGSVTFTPGARTYWHSHTDGQLLVVTAGQGWVCTKGTTPEVVRAGDLIWVPPGEEHWHGGTADTIMTHLAVSLGPTNWADEVAQHDYLSREGS